MASKYPTDPPIPMAAAASADAGLRTRLQEAHALHQRGQLARAQAVYQEILRADPRNVIALASLGIIAGKSREFAAALQYLDAALEVEPRDPTILCNRGLALHELRRPTEALASYDRAIALKPDYAVAHYNRATVLKDLGRRDEALAAFDRAIAIQPSFAIACYQRGILLQDLGRLEAALASYERAIAIDAVFVGAHLNRGVVLHRLKRFEAALAGYDEAIAIKPDFAMAHLNRGVTLYELGRPGAAIASYDEALAIKADYADALFNRATSLYVLKDFEAALASCDRAIAIAPNHADAHYSRATILAALRRYDAAVASYDAAIALRPTIALLRGDRLAVKMHACDWSDFGAELAAIAAGVESDLPVVNPFCMLGVCESPELQSRAARIYVRELYPPDASLGPIPRRARRPKVRIAYVSADFRQHPIAALMAEVFELHDRERFEIIALSTGGDSQDQMRRRLERAFDRFIDVRGTSDKDVALLARRLEIDIAVDLAGFTTDCRPRIFAMRAAPVQISYLGYLGTMSAPYIDYLIADRTIVPAAHQRNYSEKLVYLPSYQANDSAREISSRRFTRAELRLPSAGFVFCCFNAGYKITPDVFASWLRILRRVETGVLWLYAYSQAATRHLREAVHDSGLDPGRIVFGDYLPMPDYLARYRVADLFLDTLPYNAGTTASDALWAGLPVLTRTGNTFASRVAASLLTAIGLPELITATVSEYEDLAVELATSPERLAAIRQRLAANRLSSPLFDSARFTRSLESAYEAIYDRCVAGLPPEHIDVDSNA